MKDRIAHIMRAKNLKASDFATLLGIQPSGVSHILAGRNKPSLEFVKKIKETFPEYNLDWIILGTGPMTTSEPFKETVKDSRNETQPTSDMIPFEVESLPEDDTFTHDVEPIAHGLPSAGVKAMVVLYDDGTFESFTPR